MCPKATLACSLLLAVAAAEDHAAPPHSGAQPSAASLRGQPTVETDGPADAAPATPTTVQEEFEEFVERFQKSYADEAEKESRFAIFKDNVAKISAHNAAGTHSYELGVNSFADVTPEEFANSHGLRHLAPLLQGSLGDAQVLTHEYDDLTALPSEIDWVKQGAVTDVKNQGQCGACWTFATTGALEGAWKIGTGVLEVLSEQQLVDCTATEPYNMMGCQGGSVEGAVQYASQSAICSEESYPYTASNGGQCRTGSCSVGIPMGGIKSFKQVPHTAAALMSAVAQQPVAIAIEADQSAFQLYQKGIIKGMKCGPERVDHAVLVVGYGSEAGQDYWIIKNSWSETWGERGYARVGRGQTAGGGEFGVCRLLTDPVYPVIEGSKPAQPGDVTTPIVLCAVFVAVVLLIWGCRLLYKHSRRGDDAREGPLLPAAERRAAARAALLWLLEAYAGTVASCVCFLASCLTFILGVIHFADKMANLSVEFSDCSFIQEDCNGGWRKVFTFNPNIFFDLWTPTVFGLVGIGLHCSFVPYKIAWNYVTYALFMLVNALFANMGYCGQFGIVVAAFSFASCLVCSIIALLMRVCSSIALLMGEGDIVILDIDSRIRAHALAIRALTAGANE